MEILSLNAQMLPWATKVFNKFDKFVVQFDVCCFQEAYFSTVQTRSQGKIRLARFFKDNGYFTSYPKNSFLSNHVIDSGLLTASRYPIVSCKFVRFGDASSVDRLAEKGFLHNVLETPGRKIHVINTHVQASYEEDEWGGSGLNQSARFSQFDKIFRYIEAEIPSGSALMLVGDFNITTSKEKQRFIKAADAYKLVYRIFQGFDGILSTEKIRQLDNDPSMDGWSDHTHIAATYIRD